MKEPVPPQPLVEARIAVSEVVAKENILSEDAAVRIKLWHGEIKKWQDNDQLDTAFSEGRLTLRTMSHENTKYNYKKENPTYDVKKIKQNVNTNSPEAITRQSVLGLINNDNYQRTITDKAIKGDEDVWEKGGLLPKNKDVLLDAGGSGIMRRLDPQNFLRTVETPQSSKFRLGLHSLSASLLNPDKYTLKNYEGTNLIVLMPLPLAEDVKLFYRLRQLSKVGGCASFQNAVVVMASEFTRPQLASSLDMGTTYVLVKSARHGGDSVKYVRGVGEKVTTTDTPQQCRTTARENYRSILTGLDQANEITIAYRKCGNNSKFPSFAISTKGQSDFIEVNVKLPPVLPPLKFGSRPRQNSNYEQTGFVISGTDFKRRMG